MDVSWQSAWCHDAGLLLTGQCVFQKGPRSGSSIPENRRVQLVRWKKRFVMKCHERCLVLMESGSWRCKEQIRRARAPRRRNWRGRLAGSSALQPAFQGLVVSREGTSMDSWMDDCGGRNRQQPPTSGRSEVALSSFAVPRGSSHGGDAGHRVGSCLIRPPTFIPRSSLIQMIKMT